MKKQERKPDKNGVPRSDKDMTKGMHEYAPARFKKELGIFCDVRGWLLCAADSR
jgi:hypothetical protein